MKAICAGGRLRQKKANYGQAWAAVLRGGAAEGAAVAQGAAAALGAATAAAAPPAPAGVQEGLVVCEQAVHAGGGGRNA